METRRRKPACEYGAECYRKNPEHLEKYYHPSDSKNVSPNSPCKKVTAVQTNQRLKQTTLNFTKITKPANSPKNETKPVNSPRNETKGADSSRNETKPTNSPRNETKPVNSPSNETKEGNSSRNETKSPQNSTTRPARKRAASRPKQSKKKRPTPVKNAVSSDEDSKEDEDDGAGDVTSNSWTFSRPSTEDADLEESIANDPNISALCEKGPEKSPANDEDTSNLKTVEEKIKYLFLVDMPADFYSFYEFCENQNGKNPTEALNAFGLNLVGPFDVLTEKLKPGNVRKENALCHWRFYMDPPEMQTVLVAEKGLHYGYWRDEPSTTEPFVVSNTVPDCRIHPVASTIFGAVAIHLEGYLRRCNPFEKVKATKVLAALKQWAEDRGISLSDSTPGMEARKKAVVAATFHGLGIVVDVDAKSQVGYRPLIESNTNVKKICKAAINAKNDKERMKAMELVDRLVNAANIANDECDFGNGLELGIDLFCMGSDIFNSTIVHLLSTSYSLLCRPEWGQICRAHMKNRRTGLKLSSVTS